MNRNEKQWHNNFFTYAEFIVNHPNYKGLPIKRKQDGTLVWVAPKTTEIGKARKLWAEEKARNFGLKIEAGVYAKVMLEIHPTKEKVCHICGKTMSLYYIYTNTNFQKALLRDFEYKATATSSIYDIVKDLLMKHSELKLKKYLCRKFALTIDENFSMDAILKECESKCRNGNCKLLGPGAMSNFPDRFDGYHSYNRCCRKKEDTGRFDENMKTYLKDRRAYEYWSDGNIQAANKYMRSSIFAGTTADHVGPISLGFIHDSIQLKPLVGRDNSAKRDRLDVDIIDEVVKIEKTNGRSCMSWYNQLIWVYIKENYDDYRHDSSQIEEYRLALKTNVANFMYCLKIIKSTTEDGIIFLKDRFLKPNLKYFEYDYEFDPFGVITNKTRRNITDATKKEAERYFRIAIESIDNYNEKDNRNIRINISQEMINQIYYIATHLKTDGYESSEENFRNVINSIQREMITKLQRK